MAAGYGEAKMNKTKTCHKKKLKNCNVTSKQRNTATLLPPESENSNNAYISDKKLSFMTGKTKNKA